MCHAKGGEGRKVPASAARLVQHAQLAVLLSGAHQHFAQGCALCSCYCKPAITQQDLIPLLEARFPLAHTCHQQFKRKPFAGQIQTLLTAQILLRKVLLICLDAQFRWLQSAESTV